MWIDTHCHLDAAEFDADRDAVVARAKAQGVGCMVLPAVSTANLDAVRELAHAHGFFYALGLHPMYVEAEPPGAVAMLRAALERHRDDDRLVAVGEIGLDHFVPGLDRQVQERFYVDQLQLAREFDLPVILHVRRSADALLKHLRRLRVKGGIAHAFNGSLQQALAFIDLGFKLGFGGAMTFERALRIRALARELPLQALVLETDAPDIPPQWLYRTAAQRAAGQTCRNEPAQLPRIAHTLAELRGLAVEAVAHATSANARQVLGLAPA
ncbi:MULTISPECIES: TatD family hydrolase [Caldimonas]|jgi:TatD DNase family protein|uniref:TatD family hydrolase n=1 Tax=Caldimonas TaxID=196013 RepID=UPI0003619139|nr:MULTISPECIES: TatD family hydrolase [Caldimonas]